MADAASISMPSRKARSKRSKSPVAARQEPQLRALIKAERSQRGPVRSSHEFRTIQRIQFIQESREAVGREGVVCLGTFWDSPTLLERVPSTGQGRTIG